MDAAVAESDQKAARKRPESSQKATRKARIGTTKIDRRLEDGEGGRGVKQTDGDFSQPFKPFKPFQPQRSPKKQITIWG